MSTRVVSFRMTETEYNNMMAECHQMGIGSSEWVLQKIAHSSKKDQLLENITFKLKSLRRVLAVSDCSKEAYNKVIDILNTFSKES